MYTCQVLPSMYEECLPSTIYYYLLCNLMCPQVMTKSGLIYSGFNIRNVHSEIMVAASEHLLCLNSLIIAKPSTKGQRWEHDFIQLSFWLKVKLLKIS